MNQRQKNDLDRHITGNYGEDSVPDDPDNTYDESDNPSNGWRCPEADEVQEQCDAHNAPIVAEAESNITRIKKNMIPIRLSRTVEHEKNGDIDPSCPGCQEHYESIKTHGWLPFAPRHKASTGCKSGGHNHCTCDTCF